MVQTKLISLPNRIMLKNKRYSVMLIIAIMLMIAGIVIIVLEPVLKSLMLSETCVILSVVILAVEYKKMRK